jgi:hypothetical protein
MADTNRNGVVTWPHLTKELTRVHDRVDKQYEALGKKLDDMHGTLHKDLGEVKDRLTTLETVSGQKEKSTGRALAYVTLLIAVVAILFAGIRTFS